MCTNLDLKIFDGQDKSELSMIEVAHAILAHHGEAMAFVDLTNEVQQYLGKSDEEIRERLSQFYTDLNIDGSFISLGDNTWGLRAWYPYESIDEAIPCSFSHVNTTTAVLLIACPTTGTHSEPLHKYIYPKNAPKTSRGTNP